jgi:uncharacterized DUF497 family protein
MRFSWLTENTAHILNKHGISKELAEHVFSARDYTALSFSLRHRRGTAQGTVNGKLYFISFKFGFYANAETEVYVTTCYRLRKHKKKKVPYDS